jgi:hypothetical protein
MSIDRKLTKLKAFLVPKLRSASYKWVERGIAIKASRVDRGKYKCACCGEIVGPKDFVVDHIQPVIPIETGFTNWDDYINRMFCDASNFQIICRQCDSSKTLIEREMRKSYRKLRKEQGEEDE